LSNLRATLLCVWGTGPEDVFAVGGALGNGSESLVLHYDGTRWTDLAAGGTETFWWAHGTRGTDVWAVGEKGRIAHWDGAKLTAYASGTTATLYGVWAAAADDVWAVGGTVGATQGGGAPNDVLLHFDGSSWTPSPLPQTLGRTFFKVWGTASNNLYVVGEAGTIWHRRGVQWALESQAPAVTGKLVTVNGCSAGEVYAVGDRNVLRSNGATWTRAEDMLTDDVNGVSCASPGHVVLVGGGGLKQRLVAGQWLDDFSQDPHLDLHGAWADSTGAFWAAGGDFASLPNDAGTSREGVLAYFGVNPPASAFAGTR
jgi:hypothetical protein